MKTNWMAGLGAGLSSLGQSGLQYLAQKADEDRLRRAEARQARLDERQFSLDEQAQQNAQNAFDLGLLQSRLRPLDEAMPTPTVGQPMPKMDARDRTVRLRRPGGSEEVYVQRYADSPEGLDEAKTQRELKAAEAKRNTEVAQTKRALVAAGFPEGEAEAIASAPGGVASALLERFRPKAGTPHYVTAADGTVHAVVPPELKPGQTWNTGVQERVPPDPMIRFHQQAERTYLTTRGRAGTAFRTNDAVKRSTAEAKALTSLIQLVDTPGAVADKETTMALARVLLPGQASDVQTLRGLANVGGWSDRARRWLMNAKTGETIPPHIREEIRALIAPRVAAGEELVAPLQRDMAQQLRSDAQFLDLPPQVMEQKIAADSAANFFNPYAGLRPSLNRMQQNEEERKLRAGLTARGYSPQEIEAAIRRRRAATGGTR